MDAPSELPSYALIDGALCKLSRRGSVAKRHQPLGTCISEFVVADERILVLEKTDSVLSGLPNLYCLDLDLRLVWLAELSSPATKARFEGAQIRCQLSDGGECQFDARDGRPLQTAARVS